LGILPVEPRQCGTIREEALMAEHLPVNHPLRRFYRTLAALAGLYVLAFGILGLVETWGTSLFGREDTVVLGLRTNLAFSLLSVLVGAVVFIGALVGRNNDRYVNMAGGVIFLLAGIFMMTLLQTDANLLNFGMSTCVVSFIIGAVLGVAGLYGKVGSPEERVAEESFRHGGRDPKTHSWQKSQKPARVELAKAEEIPVSGGE
jgi:hypothetical protein